MTFCLSTPSVRFHQSWLASWAEWGHGVHQDGASVGRAEQAGLDLQDVEQFAQWVELLLLDADLTADRLPGRVPATTLWVTAGGDYVGSIQLRYELTDALTELGGHIGYGIRPSWRRRGAATFALGGMLARACRLGLSRVLITCDDANVASVRTIERHGGELEDVREAPGRSPWRRYWITI